MKILAYQNGYDADILRLWNTAGARTGYAPQTEEGLGALMLRHPEFCPQHTFMLEDGGKVRGFVNGTTGDSLFRGDVRGYLSCVILEDEYNTLEATRLLITALEDSFRAAGKTEAAVTCFNPIRLPWIIPGTPGHQHNNMPGIARDIPLFMYMLKLGYTEAGTEQAMYAPMTDFEIPQDVLNHEKDLNSQGRFVDYYREGAHTGLDEMVESLHNTMWSAEIPSSGHSGMKMLVGLEGDKVTGFAGPVYPEATGRGYFAGIAVGPDYRGKGYGKVLFYKLCAAERECGAQYMSLFTGTENPARFIYMKAGFEARRYFAIMIKDLK